MVLRNIDPLVSALVRQRISAGLSQKAVAELAGLSQPNLARLESGRVVPRLSTLRALATALRCGLLLYAMAPPDPCPVCGQDDWPAGSAGNARRIHELDKHEGDPRIVPRWRSPAEQKRAK